MSVLINFLERLNRKERYFVLAHATGVRDLSIGQQFRKELSDAIGVEVPESARLFMDYHFDWLVSSLRMAYDPPARRFFKNRSREVMGNQEDLDLLVAFEERAVTHLVMIEAKASTSWLTGQLCSKVKRLEKIFFKEGEAWEGHVQPHLVLMSPGEPSADVTKVLADWEKSHGPTPWVQLNYPNERLVVVRTMADEQPSKKGLHYLVRSEWKTGQRRTA